MAKATAAGPIRHVDCPIKTATIEKFADGTYTAHLPMGEKSMGLSNGDLDGALAFVRAQMIKE